MIPIDLITGFLGAGKTTFLIKYVRYFMSKGLRVGILEYDCGAVNIDMMLLNSLRGPKCELEMVDASCGIDCLQRRFRTKLISMAMSGYDRVIVEPSGVFDMDIFFDTVRDEPLDKWYEIGSVIAVVNPMIEKDLPKEADYILASQAASAGCVVFSRTQLCKPTDVEYAKTYLSEKAAEIKCKAFNPIYLSKDFDELEDADLCKLASCGYHIASYEKLTAGNTSDFSAVSFLEIPENVDDLKALINDIFDDEECGHIMRIKGFVHSEGRSLEINATRNEITFIERATGPNSLIIIGNGINRERIEKKNGEYFRRKH